jgi:hypothetical protein
LRALLVAMIPLGVAHAVMVAMACHFRTHEVQ